MDVSTDKWHKYISTCSKSYKTILVYKKFKLVLSYVTVCLDIKGHVSRALHSVIIVLL